MASLLAFALAAPQRHPAVINPQGDGVAATVTAASLTAVSLNSTRMYSEYLESRVQFEPATYDGCDSAMPEPRRFLMVVDAREQSQKSLGVVNDAAFYARALNRVLVEPGVAESRIIDPFGEAEQKDDLRTTPWRGLGLANYWDVRPLCRYMEGRLMPLQRFVAEGGLELERRELTDVGGHRALVLESEDDVRAYFAPHADVPLLVLRELWRSNAEGRSWKPTARNSTREAVPALAIAPSIATVADELAHALPSPFACVQWRAEDGTDRPEECAAELADAVGSWGRLSEAVVLLTDLYPGNSVTFQHAARSAGLVGRFESALRILQDRLPLGPTNAQAEQWRAVNDSGLRSMLELEVCARARLLVTCNEALVNESLAAGNQPRCAKCAKLSSGFTERAVALHKARGEGKRVAW
jgi:hypothetical protein